MVSKAGIEHAVNTGSLNQRVCQLRHLDIVAGCRLPRVVLPQRFEPPKQSGLSYTPKEVTDDALPGVVRSREVESRTCRLKVGYSAS